MSTANDIMQRFAQRTGIGSRGGQQRYVWTDAFAVCNYFWLHGSSRDDSGTTDALALIDAVHQTLGRHRDDDFRHGWISGLPDEEARAHPTVGGLRIGKPLPERGEDERPDSTREWDQDGQYFHYLTRWMHALDQAAWYTGDTTFNRWARELAATAFRAFSYVPAPDLARRMYWKMSIDLSRPLVPAMGQHDPLDGYVTCLQLRSSAVAMAAGGAEAAPDLADEIGKLAEMVSGGSWATDDPLGLGGLMCDAYRLFQIEQRGEPVAGTLLYQLPADIRGAFDGLTQPGLWHAPAERRLPFRELGLVIGLRAMQALDEATNGGASDVRARLAPVMERSSLGDRILEFWLDPVNQSASTWTEHRDINEVMLATALEPGGYIHLGVSRAERS